MGDIAQLIIEQGRQAAAARAAQGEIWGRAIGNIAQVPGQVMAQQRANTELAGQQAELQQRMALQGQQQTINAGTIADQAAVRAGTPYMNKLLAADIYKDDGSIDIAKGSKMIEAGGMPDTLQSQFRSHALAWNESAAKTSEAQQKAREAQLAAQTAADTHLGNGALALTTGDHPYDAGETDAFIGHAVLNGALSKEEGAAMLAQNQQPGGTKAVVDRLVGRRPPTAVTVLPEGATAARFTPGQPPDILAAGQPKPKDEFQSFKDTYAAQNGVKTWEQLSPPQQQAGFAAFTKAKQDPAMAAVALSNAQLNETMKRLQIGQQPTPEDAQVTAESIIKHQLAPSQMASMFGGFGGAAFKRMVGTAAAKMDPNFDWEQAESDYQFGKTPGFQNTVRLMGSIQESLPRLQQSADKLANTNVRFVNGVANMTKDQLNDPTLKAFQTDALFVSDEAAKILQGGGTGSATSDNKLTQAQKVFRDSDSPAAISAAAKEVNDLIGYRHKTLTRGTYLERQQGASSTPPPPVPANVAAALKGLPAGKHTLSDGSVWVTDATGAITKP